MIEKSYKKRYEDVLKKQIESIELDKFINCSSIESL